MAKKFSDADDILIRNNHTKMSNHNLAQLVGKDKAAVKRRKRELGLNAPKKTKKQRKQLSEKQQKQQTEWSENQKKYSEYLKSPEWRERRKKVLDRDNEECQLCKGKGSHVHHKTYQNIFNEPLEDLITLCRDCHDMFHKLKRQQPKQKSKIKVCPDCGDVVQGKWKRCADCNVGRKSGMARSRSSGKAINRLSRLG